MAAAHDALFLALDQLRQTWPKRGWTWDGRVSCVASAFHVDLTEDARTSVACALRHEYTQRSIGRAPPIVQEVVTAAGGVRPDQLIFCADPADGLLAYGLWWPWGDEVTTTLRIGLAGIGANRNEVRLRELFGALD